LSRLAHTLPLLALLLAPAAVRAEPAVSLFGRGGDGASVLPFRFGKTRPAPSAGTTVRLAQADPQGAATRPASTPSATGAAEAASKHAGQVQRGGACTVDEDCAKGTYCDEGTCALVQRSFNVLYLYYRSADRRFTEVMGIYWHKRGESGYQVLFPFYWHLWSPDEQSRVVFPFYYRFERPQDRTTSTFVLNVQVRKTPTEKNYRFWPLVFYTDYGERGAGVTVLPFFHHSREGTLTTTVLPFLFTMVRRDTATGLSQGLLGGLYYWRSEGERRSKALLPIFYRSSSPGRSFTWVLPLNFAWRDESSSKLLILPLAYSSRSEPRSTYVGLVPPIVYHRTGERRRLFVFPLFYRSWDERSSLTVVGPFFRKRDGERRSLGIVPLLFTGSGEGRSHFVLFPVVWSFSSPERSTTIAGPFFRVRRGPRTSTGLFPLALHHTDESRGSRVTAVLPLFYSSSDGWGRRSRVVSPLFLYERDEDAQVKHWGLVAPPFYHRRDAEREVDLLFPLFLRWRNNVEEKTTWVVGPVVAYRDGDGATQIGFPFFWRFTDAKSGASTSFIFPLAYRHRRPDGSHSNLLFPFFYNRSATSFSAGVLPLVFVGASPGKRHAVVFPIFWHIKNERSTTTVVGPAFFRREGTGWQAGLAPLVFAGRSAEGERHEVVFPVYWHLKSEKQGYDTYVAGPAFYSRSRRGTLYGVLPFFTRGNRDGKDLLTVLPPLFYRTNDPAAGRSFLLAGLYTASTEPGLESRTLFPLYWYRKRSSPTGREIQTTTAVLPIFYLRRRPGEGDLLVTPLGGYHRDPRTATFEGLAGPVAWHLGPNARGFAVIPLLYHWTRPRERSTTTILFPLGIRHVSPERTAHVVFPLFWRFTDAKESTLVALPFYIRYRNDEGTRADVVPPFFVSIRSPGRHLLVAGPVISRGTESGYRFGIFPVAYYQRTEKSSFLAALPFIYYRNLFEERLRTLIVGPFYYRRFEGEPRGVAGGLAPIVFHKKTTEGGYTIVPPLVWHFSDRLADTRTTVVAPFFFHRKEDSRLLGVAPLFFASWDDRGGKGAGLFPLFYFRREPERKAIYTPIFGYDRSSERTQWYAGLFFRRTSPSSSLDLFVPLFLRHRNHDLGETTLFAVPFYFGRWSPEKSFHLAFPLVWRSRSVDQTATVVFPVVWDFNNLYLSRTTLIFPLLLRHQNLAEKTTSYITLPGFWLRTRPEAIDLLLFPIVWHFGGQDRSTTIAFPLYWDFKRPRNRTTIFFPVYWRFDSPGTISHVVLNTYYSRDKRDGTYNLICIPFVQVQKKRLGDIKVEFLGGLGGYERIGRNRLMTIFFYTFELEPVAEPPRGAGEGDGSGGGKKTGPKPAPQSSPAPAKGSGI
jgi:hypothetical protein